MICLPNFGNAAGCVSGCMVVFFGCLLSLRGLKNKDNIASFFVFFQGFGRLGSESENIKWNAIAVSDFDGQFEFAAKGVKSVSKKNRKPPTLIKFGAPDPEYEPECKDESHPGSDKFDQMEMNREAQGLSEENPCFHVWGQSGSDKEGTGSDGMTAWANDSSMCLDDMLNIFKVVANG